MAKKPDKWSIFIAILLIGTALAILLFYAILLPILGRSDISMPCNIQVIITILISFGVTFALKLLETIK